MRQLRISSRPRATSSAAAFGLFVVAHMSLGCAPAGEGRAGITVYAAADLAFAFRDLTAPFERVSDAKVTLVLGSTGTLAKQIENGAPADVFFAANEAFVEPLEAQGLLVPGTRTLYAQGRLVLATARRQRKIAKTLNDLLDPSIVHVALANPAHAPYGQAAREAMEHAGVWERVLPKLVYAENVRQALQFVQSGAAEAAVLSRSVADAPEIEWVAIDPRLHQPLNQSVAILKRSTELELAESFVRFVNGPEGRLVMKRYGFFLPGEF